MPAVTSPAYSIASAKVYPAIIAQPPPCPRKGGCPLAASPTSATRPATQLRVRISSNQSPRPSSGRRSRIHPKWGKSRPPGSAFDGLWLGVLVSFEGGQRQMGGLLGEGRKKHPPGAVPV